MNNEAQFDNITRAMNTSDSASSGRLKADLGAKKKKKDVQKGSSDKPGILRKMVKNFKGGLDFKGAKKDFNAAKASKKANYDMTVEAAQRMFEKKYGHRMSPSTLKDEAESGKITDKGEEYLRLKKYFTR